MPPPPFFDFPLKLARGLSYAMIWASGLMVLLVAVGICIDIVLRGLFGTTLPGMFEMSGHALAITCAWSFAHTLIQRGHVRVDTLYRLVPRPLKQAMDILALAGMTAIAALICYRAWDVFAVSWRLHSPAVTATWLKLWVPQLMWLAGLAVFALVSALLTIAAVGRALARDAEGFDAVAAPGNPDGDDIEEIVSRNPHIEAEPAE